MRVIGHNNNRARLGDARDLLLGGDQINPHDLERMRPKPLPGLYTLPLKPTDQAQQSNFARRPLHHADRVGFPRVFERIGVGEALFVIGHVIGVRDPIRAV